MTRIIAGQAKGRRLAVPGAGTRPTSDRAREGLFNTLAATMPLDGARVLDLFAGTGAVGLEALSRGAAAAVFVESNRRAVEVLRRNVETVGLPGARVVPAPVSRFLGDGPGEPFDLVFADPPYADGDDAVSGVLAALATAPWLAADALVVVERSSRAVSAGWTDEWLTAVGEKRYGEALLWYGRRR
ncbi:16S rRNA (guanine966-N2)-methyltransferase [Jatrophihabitans endophyticus]|uniref:16S rRNA (Guanine966-N2)-methyltransferase n=1 Tax=Jatrophihabitans endophyticus TaxID=1206085 RepID=A0A1M5D1U8_9ACTN|nr:16S rRNA (guanine(966)-N(2))-methyltransferase RsmD [Jatrophihabitans endophyticus]SHF61003.1 16S rRNA (guanine966-N2)-methyltransferase [Jatrophihabitans endophyticus]